MKNPKRTIVGLAVAATAAIAIPLGGATTASAAETLTTSTQQAGPMATAFGTAVRGAVPEKGVSPTDCHDPACEYANATLAAQGAQGSYGTVAQAAMAGLAGGAAGGAVNGLSTGGDVNSAIAGAAAGGLAGMAAGAAAQAANNAAAPNTTTEHTTTGDTAFD